MTTPAPAAAKRGKEWLDDWDPENETTWDHKLAWRTLWITTFNLTLAFSAWFLASALAPKLNSLGFNLTKDQLYWLVAMPGLAGGTLRIIWTFLPPILGTRKLVTLSSALLLIPLIGWGMAVQDNTTPYWQLMVLALLSGIGGGVFSGFMPSTSYFFPRSKQGTALGLQAGIGNFGVSLVQFVTPWIVSFSMLAFLGGAQSFNDKAKGVVDKDVWYQNAAYIYVPFVIIGVILAWTLLKSVPVQANFRQQRDIFSNKHTWFMTLLYVMTFGSFAGFSAQFGLLIKNLYGAGNTAIVETLSDGTTKLLLEGYTAPDPLKYAFLGPLIGAGARIVWGPLTDRFGGAVWTTFSGVGLLVSTLFTLQYLSPDVAGGAAAVEADFTKFLWGMLAIFFFAGIGNSSTFKQMPMIFERRQAGGVIGWTSAIAAYGPFVFGVALATFAPAAFFWSVAAFYVVCIGVNWWFYQRKGAEKRC